MTFKLPSLILLLIFCFSVNILSAQFLDSLKKETQKAATTINDIFKHKQKNKSATKSSSGSNSGSTSSNDDTGNTTSYGSFESKSVTFSSDALRPLNIPIYNGLPIMRINMSTSYVQGQKDVKEVELYYFLMHFNINEEFYKKRKSPFVRDEQYNTTYKANDILIKLLRGGILKEEYDRKYFCSNGAGGCLGVWGGNDHDEFKRKKVYEDFMKSGIYESLLTTANAQTRQCYFLGQINLDKYDFEKKGFSIWLSNNPWAKIEAFEIRFFLSMPSDEAEALRNRIRVKAVSGLVTYPAYLLFKLEYLKTIDAINKNEGGHSVTGGSGLMAKLASPVISLYEDPELKKKFKDIGDTNSKSGSTDKEKNTGSESVVGVMDVRLKDKNLRDFKLISYKNLPLLGVNEYTKELVNRLVLREDQVFLSYDAYDELITVSTIIDKLKKRQSPFAKLVPDKNNHGYTQESLESMKVNSQLRQAAGALVNDNLYNSFFCDANNCSGNRKIEGKHNGYKSAIDRWSSPSSDEFEQRAAYKKFEESGSEQSIIQASGKISRHAYYLTTGGIENYDFEKEAFPFTVHTSGFSNETVKLVPAFKTELKSTHLELFYKISPDKAKELKDKFKLDPHHQLYPVLKVEQKFLEYGQKYLEITDAQVDVYADQELRTKVFTVTIQ